MPADLPWQVQFINRDQQAARIRRWRDEAITAGVGVGDFVMTLRAIDEGLSRHPVEFGDPLYRAASAKYTVYHRMFGPLQVWYAIPEAARVVWVQEIRPRAGLGFSED